MTSVLNYLKAAFLFRWNLLAVSGAMGFALLSGHADIFAPLVLAGEITYLGLLASHSRFQRSVDAARFTPATQEPAVAPQHAARRILASLPPQLLQRFEDLRDRCMELRQIGLEIKDPGQAGVHTELDRAQMAGLDRLLWVYLRLLFTRHSLERFMHKTDQSEIEQDIAQLEGRLKHATEITDVSQKQKVLKTLEDNLQTCRDRLVNYRKAQDNLEWVQLEIDRLENKIRSISELTANRQEPEYISGQVDQVASSMVEMERTMNDLQFATGLTSADDEAPPLLRQGLQERAR